MYNIFQGNDLLLKTVASALNYDVPDSKIRSYMTSDIYFQAFFYLTQRFGVGEKYDDYKDAGNWRFKVDEYMVQISLNSSWVSFIVFGNSKHKRIAFQTPYGVKRDRTIRIKRHLYVDIWSNERTEAEIKIMNEQFIHFCKENGIDDTWTNERYKAEKEDSWIEYLKNYNENLIDVSYKDFTERYGTLYENNQTRKALRVLKKFLKNMLSPFYVRDVPYNIKGQCDEEMERYRDNIDISFISE